MVASVRPDRDFPDQAEADGAPEAKLHHASRLFAEIRNLISRYIATRKDIVAASAHEVLFKAILGVALGVVAIVMLTTAAVLAITGLADAIGAALGGRAWAGALIVGWGLILIVAAAVFVLISKWRRQARANTIQRYEHNHPRS